MSGKIYSEVKPVYIFDLDGTLALIEHRRHLVTGPEKAWDTFYKACVADRPNQPVIDIFNMLEDSGALILIFSGRSDAVWNETVKWLEEHVSREYDYNYGLVMRPNGDSTPDEELKRNWFIALPEYVRENVKGVFDDRKKVVDMWRSLGLTCFQVAPGDF